MLTFILGGARSGKSSYAERLATEHGGPVLYVATARAWDSDMAARIRRHQADRPAHWRTLEAPLGVGAAVTDWLAAANEKPAVILLDCLTLLANNVIAPLPEDLRPEVAEEALAPEIAALTECIAASGIDWIVVSNEVGLWASCRPTRSAALIAMRLAAPISELAAPISEWPQSPIACFSWWPGCR